MSRFIPMNSLGQLMGHNGYPVFITQAQFEACCCESSSSSSSSGGTCIPSCPECIQLIVPYRIESIGGFFYIEEGTYDIEGWDFASECEDKAGSVGDPNFEVWGATVPHFVDGIWQIYIHMAGETEDEGPVLILTKDNDPCNPVGTYSVDVNLSQYLRPGDENFELEIIECITSSSSSSANSSSSSSAWADPCDCSNWDNVEWQFNFNFSWLAELSGDGWVPGGTYGFPRNVIIRWDRFFFDGDTYFAGVDGTKLGCQARTVGPMLRNPTLDPMTNQFTAWDELRRFEILIQYNGNNRWDMIIRDADTQEEIAAFYKQTHCSPFGEYELFWTNDPNTGPPQYIWVNIFLP